MTENETRYTNKELLNNVCNKSFRASWRNHEKLNNCGLEDGKKYELGNNISIKFYAYHGGIRKRFYWGTREILKKTAIKRLEKGKY